MSWQSSAAGVCGESRERLGPVLGVVHLQERILTVVEVGTLVGVSRVGLERGARPRLVALRVGAAAFALLVDEVLGVHAIDAADVVALGSAERPVVAGRLQLGGSTVTTLQPEALLAAVKAR